MQISYAQIREKMDAPFEMSLVGSEVEIVTKVVNIGIDARLEACNVPDRGDSYRHEGGRLVCEISVESLPVLLRRLMEVEGDGEDGDDADIAWTLVADILSILGFENVETACFQIV